MAVKSYRVHGIYEQRIRRAAFDVSIARGLADAEAGRTKTADEVFDRLERKYRAMTLPSE